MKKWFKTFWKDLYEQSRSQFYLKYILPAFAFFLFWGLIGHVVLINLNQESLVKTRGQVSNIVVRYEQGLRSSSKDFALKIILKNHETDFRLPDAYKNDFNDLQDKIEIGDTITLYTRHLWQTILGWGKQLDIYQIDKNGETLFDLSRVIHEKKNQTIILSVLTFMLWLWYLMYRQARKNKQQQN